MVGLSGKGFNGRPQRAARAGAEPIDNRDGGGDAPGRAVLGCACCAAQKSPPQWYGGLGVAPVTQTTL